MAVGDLDLGGNTLIVKDLKVGATAPGQSGTSLSSTELGVIDAVTPGTVSASKAFVADASGRITSGLKNLTFDAGTTAVAPIVLTPGTNLTTAAAGAFEFDGKVFYDTAVASSRQVVDSEQFILLTANNGPFNNSGLDSGSATAVFNSVTNGTLTAQAATTYFFDALYMLSNTGTTSHTWSTLFGGTATYTGITYYVQGYTGITSAATITAASGLQINVATAVPVTAASTSATEFVSLKLNGIIRVNGAGTIIPQMQASTRPGASGTPGVNVLTGSYFRLWPVGNNSVVSVGNWS